MLYFGYPITPATPIMEYLAKRLPERGGRAVQMEDEISSIAAGLGSQRGAGWSLTVTLPGKSPRLFEKLSHASKEFGKLNWVGFVSDANHKTTFYLDDIALHNAP